MQEIIHFINNWFIPKQAQLESFARNDVRVEGWFKGELLLLFESLKMQHIIEDFSTEVSIEDNINNRNQIDFQLQIKDTKHLFELKALCISQAKNTPRNLSFYFRDDNVGLINDFRKLGKINHQYKWILGFVYPKPSEEEWQNSLNQIPNDLKQHWRCVSSLDSYPDYFFISLWKG